MQDNLLLRDFRPISRLKVPQHQVKTPRFPVFDIHTHFGPLVLGEQFEETYDTGAVVQALRATGVTGVCNLELIWGDMLDRQLNKLAGHEDFILTFASLDLARMEDPDFAAYADATFAAHKARGIRGIKLWKNLGLSIKDSAGKYVAPDDPRLRPVWEAAAKHGLPVLIHIADPPCFFHPADATCEYYECLAGHPEWSFAAPELYSFERLMEAQENMVAQNPGTTFVIAHVGSAGEDLGFVSTQLDRCPNMYVDTAARVQELGRQPFTARDFLIKYQDRVLFGTDYMCGDPADIYPYYFRFFETRDEYFRYGPEKEGYGLGRWNIYGVDLPDDVLKKIYSGNAKKLLGLE